MKLLILAVAFMTLVTCLKPIHAGEFSVTAGQRTMDKGEDFYNVEDWNYIQFNYQPEGSNWYYFISKEEAEVAPSYFVWTYDMTGIGVGTKVKLTKNIKLFGQVGYYIIKNDWGHRTNDGSKTLSEGMNYYFNRRFYGLGNTEKYHKFNDVSIENDNSVGGTIGIELTQPITDRLSLGFTVSKRILKINEDINVKSPWWAVAPNRDYSSTNFGLTLTYDL